MIDNNLKNCDSVKIDVGFRNYAIVDIDDEDMVLCYLWYINNVNGVHYARRTISKDKKQYMHTLITGFDLVDHRNGNGLDNRKCNLREATHSNNIANQKKSIKKKTSSKYKGVSWEQGRRLWFASICVDYKTKYLGRYSNEEDAARAYDLAAKEYFGDFARLNFEGDVS